MEDELEDMFNAEGGCIPVMVPATSMVTKLREAREMEDNQINTMSYNQHQSMLQLECNFLSKRLKSFELLRMQEECVRYHTLLSKSEADEGRALSSALISEFLSDSQRLHAQTKKAISYVLISTVFSGQISPPAPEATRKFVETYLNEYQHTRKISQNIYFPWQSFDDGIFKACVQLLESGRVDDCRTYLLGYIEVIARVPVEEQTVQGRQCVTTAGSALGRHPFGSYFAKFLVAMKIILMRINIGSLTAGIIKAKIHDFVSLTALVWDLR